MSAVRGNEVLMMHKAYEVKEEFSPDGRRLVRREWSIGPIVIWAVVAVAAIWRGQAILPANFWWVFKP